MSEGPGLIVDVGGARARRVPGALVAGAGDDADVPFAPGEEFPFDDCAANVLAIGAFATRLSPAAALHLLLECRRVLRPGGVIHVATDDGATSDGAGHGDSSEATERLERLATMAGLERAQHVPQSGVPFDALFAGGIAMTKRERRVRGDPLVSIVIPAYNPRFFAECLDSALRQTYGNTDIVVTDDSAGPEIASIVASRGSQRPVRYQRNPTQLRPRGNFIRCFEEARGEFVKFLCDDDVLAPACVEQLVDAFRRAPDVTLATSVAHASTKRACDCPICRRRSRSSAKAASSPGTRSRTPC